MKRFGLTSEQVAASKAEYGDNRLTEIKKEGFWAKFLNNLGDPMIKILCIALGINFVIFVLTVTGVVEGEADWIEMVGIAAAVLIATLVSTFSEYKNENAFQKLQSDASAIVCKVYRDGQIAEVLIDDLVVGDCILMQSGDKVPADGILIDGSLHVDQAVLNGETKEATKIVRPDGYQEDPDAALDFLDKYKLFRGSVVVTGNAIMQVTTVGDQSVYGKICGELQQEDDRDTPLKVKLSNLAHSISKFGYIGGILIAVALLFQRIVIQNNWDLSAIIEYCSNWVVLLQDVIAAVMLAVIIIVMAVPEGLPLMIAIVSAQNMGKMLKDNVLVRKVAGIETAGSLNILFSDKTGTITKGELEVVNYISGGLKEYKTLDTVEEGLQSLASLCIHGNTSSVVSKEKDGTVRVLGGNATERALLSFGVTKEEVPDFTKVRAIPFNSTNKYSASQISGVQDITLIKGAPEKILERCKFYYDENGESRPFEDAEQLNARIDALAVRAIRMLALATCKEQIEEDDDALPGGEWTLVGVVGIRDEVRPEAITAIEEVHHAGVQVVMITGDRLETAVAIAKEAGLLTRETDITMTSDTLAKLSDDELKEMLPNIRVIARALPSDKSRLVRVAQDLNLVVGMTGDGVNDSPALKAADVGFAMGGGTEVAKEASEIIIMDNNFSSIDKAILYGRTIFNSIRKFIIFQLTINVAAVLVSFTAPLLGMETNPLTITQILWINLVMDTLAALAFGGEPALRRFMHEKPKKRDENIVSKYMWSAIITGALFTFAVSMVFLFTDIAKEFIRADEMVDGVKQSYFFTAYFTFFVFVAVFNAFNARTDRLNLFENLLMNKGFLSMIFLIIVVQIGMTYFGREVFHCYGLTGMEWVFILIPAILIIPVDLLRKTIIKFTKIT
ncbi:MAG: calcium-translocating P-type ATPase, PMCA-type [Proteobacteria bacterium]|nr:calcium-translocating P-type ATPase, PMCA-type [Pseudomonadota bacterium]